MASFPGPQKNKVEAFIYNLYEGNKGQQISKQEIMQRVRSFEFAPDVQVFFEELPNGSFSEDRLVSELNSIIQRRGRTDAIGGKIEKRNNIPKEWEEAYREYAGKKAA